MKRRIAVGLIAAAVAGCSSEPKPTVRTPANPHIFDATSMRIHPVFTKVADFDGDNNPDGIEAVLQFQDQFGDPTKAVGRVIFELYQYRPYNPDPRGTRLSPPFEGRLDSLQDQRARWNNATGAYIFQLSYPQAKLTADYCVTATFEPLTGGRFTDTDVIEGDHQKPGATQPAPLTTQPATTQSAAQATPVSADPARGAVMVVGQPSQESTSAPAHQPPARSDQP